MDIYATEYELTTSRKLKKCTDREGSDFITNPVKTLSTPKLVLRITWKNNTFF
jgi:hypothetical protein